MMRTVKKTRDHVRYVRLVNGCRLDPGGANFVGTTCYFYDGGENLGEYWHDADVGLVDGFLGYLQLATKMSITVFFTLLGCVKVLVSETAELALEHSPALLFQLAYHLQTSRDGA